MAEEADRISALPLDIKLAILTKLGTKEAVRTSALSRSWRHQWTFLSDPDFGCFVDDSCWFEITQHILSSLRGPLRSFLLAHPFGKKKSAQLRNLLESASQRFGSAVETLLICNTHGRVSLRLPNFDALKVLRLSCCRLSLPPGFQGFKSLLNLELLWVRISNSDLQSLIGTSKQLSVFKCNLALDDPSYSVTIRSQYLTHLEFDICVRVVSAPNLEKVIINLSEEFATLQLLSSITMVSSLELSLAFLQSLHKTLSLVGVRRVLPKPFNKLRCLKLFMSDLTIDKRTFDVFTCLLRSAPFLKELKIQVFDLEPPIRRMSECMKKQDEIPCLNQSLTSVTIKMIKLDVFTSILWMIRFLLLNANVLKLMTIKYSEGSEVESSFIEELRKVKVASPDAKLVILRCEDKVKINVR